MLKKVFGPLLSEIGKDLPRLYAVGRDQIVQAASRKIPKEGDSKKPNLRVAHDVMWNGAFTDDEVCAEYFGGILASSRSKDGKDDSSIQFVDVVKSLSSKQLCLHYLIFNCLNKLLVAHNDVFNIAMGNATHSRGVYLSTLELQQKYQINVDADFVVLYRQGLIYTYKTNHYSPKNISYAMAKPTIFGVMLYAAAHNRREDWLRFCMEDFGDFEYVSSPRFYAKSLEELEHIFMHTS